MFFRITTAVKVFLYNRFGLFFGNGTFKSWDTSTERVLVSDGLVLFEGEAKDRIVHPFRQYSREIVLDA